MRVFNIDITTPDAVDDHAPRWRRLAGRALAVIVAYGAPYLGYVGAGIRGSRNAIEREPLDTDHASQAAVG